MNQELLAIILFFAIIDSISVAQEIEEAEFEILN